ncbi:hypothetical protein [Mucilaginibacter aquatilis]|uniref:Uncharacterized protein n=1 Tax=Mucilaginibacter aquatilis TaxID=1517760 RepID=A0A6I4IQG5_9SPHI|nr:hypothetical protein [Mucilaginibacter aquatilis]MVN91653.1 hypothetical protein [Mucilaginibacter aquatilis]
MQFKNIVAPLVAFLCYSGINNSLYAQNSDISSGVKAPLTVKVDGKITEWGNLPAYNKATTVRYTLANDANNLYLVLNCTDNQNINKLLAGGLTFTINKDGKKKEKDAVQIQYPLQGKNGGGFRGMRFGGRGTNINVDTAALVNSRKQMVAAAKEISVIGIKQITDTLISIYNTDGIKTGINFDSKGNLFYELAVPLKLLELSAGNATELAYNLKLNGMQFGGNRERGEGRPGGNGGGNFGGNISISGGGAFGDTMLELMSPTDFWGKYKLAKP